MHSFLFSPFFVCLFVYLCSVVPSIDKSQDIPQPHTFTHYDSREFHDQEITFSSLTYLLDAIRMLSHSMSIIHSPHEPGDKALTSTDAKFVNWGLYLPHCKREIVRPDGTVDETMFFAHLVVNTYALSFPPSHIIHKRY